MEDLTERIGHRVVEEDKTADSYGGHEGGCREDTVVNKVGSNLESSSPEHRNMNLIKQVPAKSNQEDRSSMEPDSKVPSSSQKEKDAQLESARAEMGEVRLENLRLKTCLNQIMEDYRTLQMQFHDIVQQEEINNPTETENNLQATDQETELVSLTLGFSNDPKKDGKNVESSSKRKDHRVTKDGLSLGLDCKLEMSDSHTNGDEKQSPINSFKASKVESKENNLLNKASKIARSGDEEVQQQNPVRKARVSLKTRCDTLTVNDGCQWRKYGQKIAKGNPCPRAYYRCTIGPTCPVRKQVQRYVEDMSILITTYEGTHNHPLPASARGMASTTSAAASMLLSGSSSNINPTTAVDLHGLKFYLSDNSKSRPLHVYNNPSLSSSSSHPTITLDLTSTPSSSSPFTRFSSTYPQIPEFASTSLNFGSRETNQTMPWRNMFPAGYGSDSQPYLRNPLGMSNLGRTQEENNLHQSYIQKYQSSLPQHPLLPDTIVAATKAITGDPTFQSALEAALMSIIGTGGGGNSGAAFEGGNQGSGDKFVQKLK
ncbi:hypothetical protein K2173_027057 [Erythroxylum novogranatense]|uniref:WRKY domain-containing protein n=1 Tax=Erythroxylum novogranatense TaxID=1862640 RepID=A0AAV8TY42_9ROSI|nr:hypothetical protein K2173_027057 [Erythroxylum novogranatense]